MIIMCVYLCALFCILNLLDGFLIFLRSIYFFIFPACMLLGGGGDGMWESECLLIGNGLRACMVHLFEKGSRRERQSQRETDNFWKKNGHTTYISSLWNIIFCSIMVHVPLDKWWRQHSTQYLTLSVSAGMIHLWKNSVCRRTGRWCEQFLWPEFSFHPYACENLWP